MQQDYEALTELRAMRANLARSSGTPGAADLDRRLAELEGSKEERRPWLRKQVPALLPWNARLTELLEALQTADVAPTPQLAQAAETTIREVAELASRWASLKRDASTLLR